MKIKKLALSLLLSLCAFATACGSNKGSGGPTANGVVNEGEKLTHYVDGTLHNVNVDFDMPVSDFVVNGKTDYKIVLGKAAVNKKASKTAAFVAEHIYKATGAQIEYVDGDTLDKTTVSQNTQYIFIGCEELFVELGGEMPTYEEIGVSGYSICTYGKNVFLNGYATKGYQLAGLAFLREVIGYDMLSADCVIYEKDGKVMPAMDIVERPDFDYRQAHGAIVEVEKMGMGFDTLNPIIEPNNAFCHNWHEFVTNADAKEHPEWRSVDETGWQGCWTTRGNQESYTQLINHLTEKIKGFMKVQPDRDSIIIGQNDIGIGTPPFDQCTCPSCRASFEYYGTMAGAWLSLCNRVSLKVDEWLKTEEAIAIFGENKKCYIVALAYHASLNPPVEKEGGEYLLDENGAGIPKKEMWFNSDGSMVEWDEAWKDKETGESKEEELIADWSALHERIYSAPSVHFMFAASHADYTHSFYEYQNAGWTELIDGWKGVGGEFYFWLYTLNSRGSLYPFHSWDTSFETTRYIKDVGAKYVYWQGQYQNKNNSGFVKLRTYLESKVEFDVNADYEFYLNKFFKYYYGVAADTMRQFFKEVLAQCRYIEIVNGVTPVHTNTKLMDAKNWPKGLIQHWMGYAATAYELIEQEYKATNPELYEMYTSHVMMEELFPLYVLCTSYADTYKPSEIKAMRLTFIDNFYALGNTCYMEGQLMSVVTSTWDLD